MLNSNYCTKTTTLVFTLALFCGGLACSSDATVASDSDAGQSSNSDTNADQKNSTIDSDGDGINDDLELELGTDPNNKDTDGDGLTDGDELLLKSDPTVADNEKAGCAYVSSDGTLVKKPVDVVVIIDNSSSMGEEIAAVVNNISQNFADILENSGLDYRIILLSYHGDPNTDPDGPADRPICIREPLSGTDCDPLPEKPVNTDRFFHYHVTIDSTNSLQQAMNTYATADINNFAPSGWSQWLRDGASRVFLEITDDRSTVTADAFESWLFSRNPATFGTAEEPNYVFHSIIGITEKETPTDAWLPTEAVQNSDCSSAANPGPEYERLSIRSGGLRFPVCQTDSYDIVFQTIAQGVIEGTAVSCRFDIPSPPEGATLDVTHGVVLYEPGDGSSVQRFTQVANADACDPDGFYVTDTQIELCPTTCTTVSNDDTAHLSAHFPCAIAIQ